MTGQNFIRKTFLFFLALALLLPCSAGAADKTVALFPLVIYSAQPKAFLGPGLKSMFGGGRKDLEEKIRAEQESVATKKTRRRQGF